MSDILYKKLVYDIIGCAMEVHNILGYGFLEKVYENALMIELRNSHIPASQQVKIKVNYKNIIVGDYTADILVDNKIVLELKAVTDFSEVHIVQTLNYLRATGFKLALLINFGKDKLEYKRLIY